MAEDLSARLGLPLLRPGQAQKELGHNEALALIDIAVHAGVVAAGVDTPPEGPDEGRCWVVGASPTGAWAGHPREIACWTAGGWRFVRPVEGMTVWVGGAKLPARYVDGIWTQGELRASRLLVDGVPVVGAQQPAIAAPTGGTVVDDQARSAIGLILATLRAHGLTAL